MSIKTYPVIRLFPGMPNTALAPMAGAGTASNSSPSEDHLSVLYPTATIPVSSKILITDMSPRLIAITHSSCLAMGTVKNPSVWSEESVARYVLQPETPSPSELVHRHYPQVPVEGPVNQEPPDGEITFGKDLLRCMQSTLKDSEGNHITDIEKLFDGLEKVPFDE